MTEPDRLCSRCGERYGGGVIFCPADGAPLGSKKPPEGPDPYLGRKLPGGYEVEQLIGVGAMGRVYRARDFGMAREVAIKILHRELLESPSVVQRFEREARIASRLVHPNVVQMLNTGRLEEAGAAAGGEPYLVMEYLDGISLRSALAAAGGALPLPRALHIVLAICDAVGEAHAQGIVHRDLKPENVMLVRRGDDPDFVKVLDFGVARIERSDASIATQAGTIFGTARYVSPEGAQGKTVTPESDVYSLGVLAFECLSGRTPFDGENPIAILIQHTNQPAPLVTSIPRASYVPEPLSRAIDRALAKAPKDRAENARELGRSLVEAARESGLRPEDLLMRPTLLGAPGRALSLPSIERTKALPLGPASLLGTASPAQTNAEATPAVAEPDVESDWTPPRSRSKLWVALLVVVGCLALLAAVGGRLL
ncbi:MAG: protein kinase [Polyangiaceae bacterium]